MVGVGVVGEGDQSRATASPAPEPLKRPHQRIPSSPGESTGTSNGDGCQVQKVARRVNLQQSASDGGSAPSGLMDRQAANENLNPSSVPEEPKKAERKRGENLAAAQRESLSSLASLAAKATSVFQVPTAKKLSVSQVPVIELDCAEAPGNEDSADESRNEIGCASKAAKITSRRQPVEMAVQGVDFAPDDECHEQRVESEKYLQELLAAEMVEECEGTTSSKTFNVGSALRKHRLIYAQGHISFCHLCGKTFPLKWVSVIFHLVSLLKARALKANRLDRLAEDMSVAGNEQDETGESSSSASSSAGSGVEETWSGGEDEPGRSSPRTISFDSRGEGGKAVRSLARIGPIERLSDLPHFVVKPKSWAENEFRYLLRLAMARMNDEALRADVSDVEKLDSSLISGLAVDVNLLKGDPENYGNTVAHEMVADTSDDDYEKLILVMAQLETGDIFCVENVEGDTPIHWALKWRKRLRPHTVQVLAAKCHVSFNAQNRDGESLLHLASEYACAEVLEAMLWHGGNVSLRDKRGCSVLHRAAASGNASALYHLVSSSRKGFDLIHSTNKAMQTPLHCLVAANSNFAECLSILMHHWADIDAVDEEGYNLSFYHVYYKRPVAELKEILRHGCNWRARSFSGLSVLHLAAQVGNVQALQHFISLGADVNETSLDGETPFHFARLTEQAFTQVVKILAENGAEVNAEDEDGNTLLHLAAVAGMSREDIKYAVEEIGCNWRATNELAQTTLHSAAEAGNLSAIQYFLSLGADVNAKDKHGVTPLLHLVHAPLSFLSSLELLRRHGAGINKRDLYGNSLLLSAARSGRSEEELDAIRRLGGRLRATTKVGDSVLHMAALGGHVHALKYFISKGANVHKRNAFQETPLLASAASQSGDLEQIVDLLTRHGAELNAVNLDGCNLLFLAAAYQRSTEDMKTLVRLGVKWDVTDGFGHSILHVLAEQRNFKAAAYFIARGADVNARNIYDETPLLRVPYKLDKFVEAVSFLVRNGASIDAADMNGNCVLLKAISAGAGVDQLTRLLALGANVNAKNVHGEGALELAAVGASEDTVRFLKGRLAGAHLLLAVSAAEQETLAKLYHDEMDRVVGDLNFCEGQEHYLRRIHQVCKMIVLFKLFGDSSLPRRRNAEFDAVMDQFLPTAQEKHIFQPLRRFS